MRYMINRFIIGSVVLAAVVVVVAIEILSVNDSFIYLEKVSAILLNLWNCFFMLAVLGYFLSITQIAQ